MGLWACGLLRNGRRRKGDFKSDFIQISYLNMGSSNTMGVRVTTGDLMYLCGSGLMPNDYAWNSRRLFEVQEALSTAAESHVVHYDDLEPHGAGGDGF